MQKLKIFIAGSKALESERSIVRNVLMQFQTRWGIMIEAKSFEDFGYSLTKEGRQNDYNQYITQEADLLIVVFASRVGNVTMGEFMLAYSTFLKDGHPEILVFVEQNMNNISEVEVLKQTMTNLNQYYIEYDSLDDLKNLLSEELTKYISEHKEFLIEDNGSDAWSGNEQITDPEELFNKGYEYYLQSDYDKAYPLIKRAAEFGNSNAQFFMGVMFQNGQGVKANCSEAFRWFMKAANNGVAEAQCNIGLMYLNGLGVEENPVEAIKWYKKAAEADEATAQFNMGVMCYNGNGLPQDYAQAFRWFMKAAEKGHSGAQRGVGQLLYYGQGVDLDYSEAIKWFKKAAAQGEIVALRSLGLIYQHGEVVEKDYEESAKWYLLAAQKGDRSSMAALKEMGYNQ